MKRITIITLSIIMLLQPFSKIFIVISFKMQQDKIAKTICIEKEIQNNDCEGKCELKRQLAEDDEQDSSQTNILEKGKLEVLYCHYQILLNFSKYTKSLYFNNFNAYYNDNFLIKSFIFSIFHPPQLNLII